MMNLEERWSGWTTSSQIEINRQQIRLMIAHAVGTTLRATLKNHIFKFADRMYIQEENVAIEISMTGDVACLFMTWWGKGLK